MAEGGAGFSGFPEDGLAFLRGLAAHQDRAWFMENRAVYETRVKAPMQALVGVLSEAFAARGMALRGDPAKAMFRINRDVRFSRDKAPYKTHASAVLTRDGAKGSPGVFYVHIDPAGSFAACGFFRPEAAVLERLRRAIALDAAGWHAVLVALKKSKLSLAEDEDALKRLPQGFDDPGDAVVAAALRRKSFVVRMSVAESVVTSGRMTGTLVGFAERAMPLLGFGWEVLE